MDAGASQMGIRELMAVGRGLHLAEKGIWPH